MKKYLSLLLLGGIVFTAACGKDKEEEQKPVVQEPAVEEVKPEPVVAKPVKQEKTNYELSILKDLKGQERVIILGENQGGIYRLYDELNQSGFMNSNGDIILEPQAGYSELYEDILIVYSGENNYYFTDLFGRVILEQVNDKKISLAESMNDGYIQVELYNEDGSVEDKDYIIDSKGNIVFETEEGFEIVELSSDVYGLIESRPQTQEEIHSTLTQDAIISYHNSDGSISTEEETAQYKEEFKNLGKETSDRKYIINGTSFVKDESKEGVYAIFDGTTGKAITGYDFVMDSLSRLDENFLVQRLVDETAETKSTDGKEWVIIDGQGNIILNLTDKYGAETYYISALDKNDDKSKESFVTVGIKDKGIVVLDNDGNVVKETNYQYIKRSEAGTISMSNWENQFGYLDQNFEEILAPEYDTVSDIDENGQGMVIKENVVYRLTIKNK